MKLFPSILVLLTSLAAPAVAQGKEAPAKAPAKASRAADADAAPDKAAPEKAARTRVQLSDGGKAALAAAKDLAARCKGLRGAERAPALEQAAAAYDKIVADFPNEPAVAGQAAFAAAELWQQHGSLALAEKDYLLAADIDAPRFGQRALLGAADAQRRQKHNDQALQAYQKAIAVEPSTPRAQEARLEHAHLLQSLGRLDEAITAFQSALETAHHGKQVVDAANLLALALLQKGDLDAADRAIDHAEQSLAAAADEDPVVVERLKKAVDAMSAKKALRRARDKASRAAKDAVGLEQARTPNSGG